MKPRTCWALPLAALLLTTFSGTAHAQIVALNALNGLTGHQTNFNGALGQDFNVLGTVQVVSLGAFDSANPLTGTNDGFTNTITVTLYNRDTSTAVTSLTFTNGSPGTLDPNSSYRFKDLASGLTLGPGFHGAIVAENFGSSDPNGNTFMGDPAATQNTGGGVLSFGGARFGPAGAFPTSSDTATYLAGSFKFNVLAGPPAPEPGTLALLVGMTTSTLTCIFRKRRCKK